MATMIHHRWSFEKCIRLIALTVLVILLSACSSSSEPLKVGTNIWPGYESLYLARDSNLFDDKAIELVELPNATRVIQAIKTGDIDIAGLTLDEYLTLISAGYQASIIAVMDYSEGADVLIARPHITALGHLRDKTIVVEKTAVGALLLQGALEQGNLSLQDIHLINATVNEHDRQWENSAVDAIVTFEPVRSRLLNKGGQVLFDSSEIPGRIVDVLVATEQSIQKKPEQIKQLLKAHFRALTLMMSDPDKAASLMSARMNLPQNQIWASFEGLHIPGKSENIHLLKRDRKNTLIRAQQLQQLMLENALLSREIPLTVEIFNPSFLSSDQKSRQ